MENDTGSPNRFEADQDDEAVDTVSNADNVQMQYLRLPELQDLQLEASQPYYRPFAVVPRHEVVSFVDMSSGVLDSIRKTAVRTARTMYRTIIQNLKSTYKNFNEYPFPKCATKEEVLQQHIVAP
jgi:hypothetical protein